MDKRPVDETEYDFDAADNNISAFGEASAKEQLLEKLKGKTVYLAAGTIVIVLILYKLFSVLFSTDQPKIAPAVPTKTIQAPLSNQPNKSEFNSKLAIIENKGIEDRAKLTESIRSIARLEGSVANLQAQVNLLNNQLQELTDQLKKQTTPKKNPVKVASVVAKKIKRPVYYVQALVPERAWLKQSDGTTITVTRGDVLPGYGEISLIDLSQGIVMTTKGDIIGFHPNER